MWVAYYWEKETYSGKNDTTLAAKIISRFNATES